MITASFLLIVAARQGPANSPPPEIPQRRTLRPLPNDPPPSGPMPPADEVPIAAPPPPGAALAALGSPESLVAANEAFHQWIEANHDSLKSTFDQSALLALAVEDPLLYNVYTFLLDQAQRRADREILSALMVLLSTNDPLVRDYLASYARRLAQGLGQGQLPSEAMSSLASLDYSAPYEDRFGTPLAVGHGALAPGDSRIWLIGNAGRQIGITDDDLMLVHRLAGCAALDPATGQITVELSRGGVRSELAKALADWRDFFSAHAVADPNAPDPPDPTSNALGDMFPPEAYLTKSELWAVGALPPSERTLAIEDLARTYAQHATLAHVQRVRDLLVRLRGVAGGAADGRIDRVFDLLCVHLEGQVAQLDQWQASSAGLAGRVGTTLAQSRRRLAQETSILAAARAHASQVQNTSGDGAPLGALPRRPQAVVYDSPPGTPAPAPPSWADPGTGFNGAGQDLADFPLDHYAGSVGGAATTDVSDPVSGADGLRVECHWDAAKGKFVCTVTIPGLGSVEVTP